MRKKLLLIGVSFLIVLTSVLSCDIIGTCKPEPSKYKITAMDYQFIEASFVDGVFDIRQYHMGSDTLYSDDLAIFLFTEIETYTNLLNKIKSINLIQPLHACSPVPPTTDEILENIEIYCNEDWNSDFPSGSNLASIADIVVNDYNSGNYNERIDLETFIASSPKVLERFSLMFSSAPAIEGDYSFTIKYYQKGIDKDHFQIETEEVYLLPAESQ